MSKTTLQILKDARELISEPSRWTQGELARDDAGFPVQAMDEDAVCWCMAGATWRVSKDEGGSLAADKALMRHIRGVIPDFNDTHTHAEVLALFDAAISSEERRAAE